MKVMREELSYGHQTSKNKTFKPTYFKSNEIKCIKHLKTTFLNQNIIC